MKIPIGRLCSLTLILLLSFVAFAAAAGAEEHNLGRSNHSLQARSRANKGHKAIAESGALSTLYSFCSEANCADGANSTAGLIRDAAGNLYGTTSQGGANSAANGGTGGGTVFEVSGTGQETVLYSFCSQSNCTDGVSPAAALIQDSAGNLYGTTTSGGSGVLTGGGGTVFKLEPPAQQGGAWTEVVLYSFCAKSKACTDGQYPEGGLIQDSSGNFYGTTPLGGTHGYGTVFELTAGGKETVLYSFKLPGSGDGNSPLAGLIQDSSGNLYGTTFQGGANSGGAVFKITKSGTETVLYSFCAVGGSSCTDGEFPQADLIQDANSNLYGTTNSGGAHGFGTVFELSSTGTESVLYNFCSAGGDTSCTDGAYPVAGLLQDGAGNLYGTTEAGGTGSAGCNSNGVLTCGTLFELSPPAQQGGAWTESVLYSFCSAGGTNCTDGEYPQGGLIEDSSGNLYGTTSSGGANTANGGGTVFALVKGSQLTPTVTISSNPNPSNVGQSVTLSVVVSGSGGTPTGTVTFEEGSTSLGLVRLASGQGSITTSFSSAGSFSITADYSGDQNYKAADSSPLTQNVALNTTTTALASSPNPSNYGQNVTFTATVSSAGPTPTGTVTFLNGGTSFGSASLSGGVATLMTNALPAGTLSITASYSGDGSNAGSTSSPLSQVVKQDSTTTALASNLNPSTYGQSVTLTATVSSSGPTPTGTVTFKNGTKSLGTGTLTNGVAQLTTSALLAGTLKITASYGGDTGHAASKSPILNQVVNKTTSSTTIASSVNPSIVGQKVTFTATVTSPTTTPTGTVKFMDGSTELGTGTLKSGKATYATKTLSQGSHNITAVYTGTANIGGSTSPTLVQTVN